MFLKEQSYVCALADTGSMTLAAEKLFITQPALSAYIKALEERMGAPLFERKEGVFVPTYLGEVYLDSARRMLAMQNAFNLERRLINAGAQGRVRIGIQTRRAPMVICDILGLLKERYPHIEPVIEEGNDRTLRRLLLEDKVDLIVSSMDKRDPAFCYRSIDTEVLLFAAQKGSHVAKQAVADGASPYPVIDLRAAEHEPFILPHPDQSLRITAERLFEKHNFEPKRVLQVRSIEAAMRLAEAGFGVAFSRSGYAAFMPQGPQLQYMRLQGDTHTSELLIAYNRDHAPIPSFQCLLEQLVHALQGSSSGLHNTTL